MLLWVYDQFQSVSFWSYVGVALAYLGLQVYGTTVLSTQFFLPVKFKGERYSKNIALTFDDGPIPGKTEEILRILKLYNAPAAFFC
ncbi:MAG: polysaccharide deacetylase family protein, partial [Marivirga sp.]|nr:polysaccharide deacetylase family protein [Marivirga sp.]